ncbi:MAG: hypothetical protein KDB07_01705, partial [Planctomycetes bacterium]|nr:hypothetical protein [Planctomycetota bacterium]
LVERIDSLSLPDQGRSTTEELLRQQAPQLAPKVGGSLVLPLRDEAIARVRSSFGPLLAYVLLAISLVLVIVFVLTTSDGASTLDVVTEREESNGNQIASREAKSPSQLPSAEPLYLNHVLLDPAIGTIPNPSTFAQRSFHEQVDILDALFSRAPDGRDRLEALLGLAAKPDAKWRRAQKQYALSEFLITEGGLTRYRENSALLPSEVIASLGGEDVPLAITLAYCAERFGIEIPEFAKSSYHSLPLSVPVDRNGVPFSFPLIDFDLQERRPASALRKTFLTSLVEREIDNLNPQLDTLLSLCGPLFNDVERRRFATRIRTTILARGSELGSAQSKLAQSILTNADPSSLDASDLRIGLLAFENQPPQSWLRHAASKGVAVTLASGDSSLAAYARQLGTTSERGSHLARDTWLRAVEHQPKHFQEALNAIAAVSGPEGAQTFLEALLAQPDLEEEALHLCLVEFAKQESESPLLLALLVKALKERANLARAKSYAILGLMLAINLKSETQTRWLLEFCNSQWPEDPLVTKLRAEAEASEGRFENAEALLSRYLVRFPDDSTAEARLQEIRGQGD